jgi:hypothetical protein
MGAVRAVMELRGGEAEKLSLRAGDLVQEARNSSSGDDGD